MREIKPTELNKTDLDILKYEYQSLLLKSETNIDKLKDMQDSMLEFGFDIEITGGRILQVIGFWEFLDDKDTIKTIMNKFILYNDKLDYELNKPKNILN